MSIRLDRERFTISQLQNDQEKSARGIMCKIGHDISNIAYDLIKIVTFTAEPST
jgi:hypothetical protein